jgi:hypothetical protein
MDEIDEIFLVLVCVCLCVFCTGRRKMLAGKLHNSAISTKQI